MKQIHLNAFLWIGTMLACCVFTPPAAAGDGIWQVGLCRADITPREPILLSGYGGRDKPFERIDIPLHAKCMTIEDSHGVLAVLVTLDAECMYPHTAGPLWDRIHREFGLRREQVLINFSHSHAAPFLSLNPETKAYGSTRDTARKTVAHTQYLFDQVISVIETGLADRQPARLYFGVGVAPFVMSRREFTAQGVKIGVNARGYADRSVPILRIDDLEGKSRAVVFGCACHNTTLGGNSFVVSGDYAGYAQQYVEANHADVQAMFMIGCGGDANPYPRGTLELARAHGETLGKVVDACLAWSPKSGRIDRRTGAVPMKPVSSPLATEYECLDLPLRQVLSIEAMKAEAQGNDSWQAYHARKMLELVEQGREVPRAYNCPLAVWQFGDDLTLVAFSGEVVAGYVPLVEKAIGPLGLWVAAYCNVMYGYVPTVQVIEEGGYETRGLEIGVGQFAPDTEAILLEHVSGLVANARKKVRDSEKSISERFDPADRPAFRQDIAGDFYVCKPWNYDKTHNAKRKYPLFVYLHGGGGSGSPSSLPCLNNDKDQKAYPCFVYVPHGSDGWRYDKLILQIEDLKKQYRIDLDRVYLMGYSMGGSGSYGLINRYYDHNRHLFAGVVRMAGQSQITVRKAIAENTSIWYHVGLSDTAQRIQVAEDAYKFLKDYPANAAAKETLTPFPNPKYPGTTSTLTLNDVEIVKFTKYEPPVGHGISHLPLTDPYVLQWLFKQRLVTRSQQRK